MKVTDKMKYWDEVAVFGRIELLGMALILTAFRIIILHF